MTRSQSAPNSTRIWLSMAFYIFPSHARTDVLIHSRTPGFTPTNPLAKVALAVRFALFRRRFRPFDHSRDRSASLKTVELVFGRIDDLGIVSKVQRLSKDLRPEGQNGSEIENCRGAHIANLCKKGFGNTEQSKKSDFKAHVLLWLKVSREYDGVK